MTAYFASHPRVDYDGVKLRNLVARATMARSVVKRYGVFYPYVVREGERPDTIAFDYYGDSEYAWLVLASNDVVDPYHDWPLDQADFDAYLVAKYGTVEAAMAEVHHYASPDSDLYMYPETRANLPASQRIGFDVEVTTYSWESSLNDDRRNINLLSRRFAARARADLDSAYDGARE